MQPQSPFPTATFRFLGERRSEAPLLTSAKQQDPSLDPCLPWEKAFFKNRGGLHWYASIRSITGARAQVLAFRVLCFQPCPAFRVICFQSCQASSPQIPRKTHPKPWGRKSERCCIHPSAASCLWLLREESMAKAACKCNLFCQKRKLNPEAKGVPQLDY